MKTFPPSEYKRNEKQRYWERKQMKDGVDLRAIVAFQGDGLGNYRLVVGRFCLMTLLTFLYPWLTENTTESFFCTFDQ